MKKLFIALAAIVVLFSAFKIADEFKMSHADVNQVQGVYVFYMSKPVKEYTYLGTVESPSVIKNYKGSYLVELMVKRAKEKHPTCNAVIFTNDDLIKVDAVTIK